VSNVRSIVEGGSGVRVLGVDPGLTRCGLGVVDGTAGRPLTLVEAGVVRTPADEATGYRLIAIEAVLEDWLDRHRPDVVALERVFAQHNLHTVMGTAQASAMVMAAAARRGLPLALHTPSEVKAAVTGSGRADKLAVGTAVTRLLRLTETPKPADAADAVALAVCQVWRGPGQARLLAAAAEAAQQYPRQPRRPARRVAS
jgi:crossover junction endodeoxyribonuclease RuvC